MIYVYVYVYILYSISIPIYRLASTAHPSFMSLKTHVAIRSSEDTHARNQLTQSQRKVLSDIAHQIMKSGTVQAMTSMNKF